MKTLAAILVEQRQALVLDEVSLPPIGFGQVLVEIHATRVCGSQLGEIEGVKGPDRYLPHLLGHEAGGTVLEVGREVRHAKPGDQVVCHWRPGRGLESVPAAYDWNGRRVNAGPITTFQRFSLISENRLTVVPAGTDPELCCLLADTLTTGFGVISNDAQVRIGESVVVIGCGGIGLGVVQGARLAGAHPVIAVDLRAHKLECALRHGATHAVDALKEDFVGACRRLLDNGPADVVVDGTGDPRVLERAFELAGPRGRCIGVGVMRHDARLSLNTLPLHFGKTLKGSHGGDSQPADDIPRLLRLIRDGRFTTQGFISHRAPLAAINTLIAQMRSGEVVHGIIQLDPASATP